MNTGENQQGLQQILDMSRLISIVLIGLHFYFFFYQAFYDWGLVSSITDQVLKNILKTGLFKTFDLTKWLCLGFLFISLLGARGRKSEQLKISLARNYSICGLVSFFGSYFLLRLFTDYKLTTVLYVVTTVTGYLLLLKGGTLFSRVIKVKLNNGDIFNSENETFPQEERLIENETSVNLPAIYKLKSKERTSHINFINLFRGLLVLGSPGSGKSYYVIRHVITQHIRKGFSMFIYDFKYDDLSIIAYNHYLKCSYLKMIRPKFYTINFDNLSYSHRCNPLDKDSMLDITDAAESARTILLGLNREWIKRQGDFFIESPINFLTAIIWFLRNYQDGEFCTLPHVIELMQVDYERLFSILRSEKEIEVLINPFITAFQNNAMEQLEGQIERLICLRVLK